MSSVCVRPTLRLGSNYRLSQGLARRLYGSPGFDRYEVTSALNMRLLWGLIGINVGVWGYCMYLKAQASQGYQKGLVKFISNMSLNSHDFFHGKYWQVLTSCFTHFDPFHLAFNMMSAHALGSMIAKTPGVGPVRFLTLVIGSGLAGSAGFVVMRSSNEERGQVSRKRAVGFSGCVMGLGMAATCLYPHAKMLLMGIIPAPLWAITLGYLAYDGYYLNDNNSRIAHAGHLGGAVFGLAYYFLKLAGPRF